MLSETSQAQKGRDAIVSLLSGIWILDLTDTESRTVWLEAKGSAEQDGEGVVKVWSVVTTFQSGRSKKLGH